MVFGGGLLGGNSVLMRSCWWDPPNGISVLVRRGRQKSCLSTACTKERPWEDTVRRQPSTIQQVSPHQKLNFPDPWSWTSSLQNCWQINVCCLRCPNYDTCYGSSSWTKQRICLKKHGIVRKALRPECQLSLWGALHTNLLTLWNSLTARNNTSLQSSCEDCTS